MRRIKEIGSCFDPEQRWLSGRQIEIVDQNMAAILNRKEVGLEEVLVSGNPDKGGSTT